MNDKLARKPRERTAPAQVNGLAENKDAFITRTARILEPSLVEQIIRERQKLGIDDHDEVWEGVYVVPPIANNPHQHLVGALTGILFQVVVVEGRGQVQPGANVSDRRGQWEHSFRGPDVVVVLNDSRAIDCGTHWYGGPDFLIEIESPGDETPEKIPFYGRIQVRELLVVHRDTRQLRLYRHNGEALVLVGQSDKDDPIVLSSKVVPLSFRWKSAREGPRTEVQRTGGKRKTWTV